MIRANLILYIILQQQILNNNEYADLFFRFRNTIFRNLKKKWTQSNLFRGLFEPKYLCCQQTFAYWYHRKFVRSNKSLLS